MFVNIDAWNKRWKSMTITTKITMQITHGDKTNNVQIHNSRHKKKPHFMEYEIIVL